MKIITFPSLVTLGAAAYFAYKRGYLDGSAAREEGLTGTSPATTLVSAGKGVVGKVKEAVGAATGDVDLVTEGAKAQEEAAAEAIAAAEVVATREETDREDATV